ncbi:hypothetical protein [Fowl aviadenovirus D]|uniref:Uncharacterized protein n=1 Tax=Fowl aviadenovirus D TaxID=190064 RepID=A0A1D8BB00_9ADEN|nr:hypothetical protein [Fowl aviadenovirus D]BDB16207.1 hypothetical protein [Fowl aviadenovirus D]
MSSMVANSFAASSEIPVFTIADAGQASSDADRLLQGGPQTLVHLPQQFAIRVIAISPTTTQTIPSVNELYNEGPNRNNHT